LRQSQAGFSIVLTVVISGIAILLGFIATSVTLSIRNEQKILANKIELFSLENEFREIMARTSDCHCQVAGKTFNAAIVSNMILELSALKSSCAISAPDVIKINSANGSNARNEASRIYVSITPTAVPNEYIGNLFIQLPQETNSRLAQSSPIRFSIRTDPLSPLNNKAILGCGSAPLEVPTQLQVVPNSPSGECKFIWNRVSGNGPITYTVRGSDIPGSAASGNKICQSIDQPTSCTISGLTSGVSYFFAIQASNSTQSPTDFSSPEVSCIPSI